jgi:cation diffusion facilitator CzcD-associated flavoprotein CzcO
MLHACQYKSPSLPVPLAGKRVLVIGAGNSGCDIAVEASHHAAVTAHSTRRGYFFVPRFILGRPADLRNERLLKMHAPLWLRRLISLRAIDRAIGLPWRHGLPRPDHRLWETHPIINEDLGRRIDSGAIQPRSNVAHFDGDHVVFVDGRREPFDIVICATGYKTVLPFVDGRHLGGEAPDAVPRLFLNLLHPTRDDIAVVGLIQPDSGQWGLTDLQGRLVAAMAAAAQRAPRAAAWLYTQRQRPPRGATIRYVDSPRHRLEVEHFAYRRHLQRLIKGMERRMRRRHTTSQTGLRFHARGRH